MLATCGTAAAADGYIWQQPQATVTNTGDIRWAPQPFRFLEGDQVRYIDYENGNDANDGSSPDTAWKHHPWDRFAEGSAAQHQGITTYVFKRGSIYRGELIPDESGEPGDPIILTASAEDRRSPYYWGDGEAFLFGATRLPAQWVPATSVAHPERLPEPEKVWAIDLSALGLTVADGDKRGMIAKRNASKKWMDNKAVGLPWLGLHRIDDAGESHTLHLARTPDWQPGNPNFALDYWHAMGEGSYEYNGKQRKAAVDEWLKGHPEDYFIGGFIWQQYGSFMGGATPALIEAELSKGRDKGLPTYDPKAGALAGGLGIGPIKGGLRYMIDNLPQFLDAPGEFYHDSSTGTLFYRPADGIDPNQQTLELTRYDNGIIIDDRNHILLTGLSMRYYNEVGVQIDGDVRDVNVLLSTKKWPPRRWTNWPRKCRPIPSVSDNWVGDLTRSRSTVKMPTNP